MDVAERERREAIVGSPAGRRVVIAGPGAGKTGLLVERVQRLLEGGTRPREMLTLVFNRRAAAELRQRLAVALPDRGFVELRISTYHSFALALADRFWHRTGLPARPALLPAEEQRALVRALLVHEPDPDGWHVESAVRRSSSFGRAVADAVLRAQEQLVSADELAERDPAAGRFLRRYLDAGGAGARLDHAGVLAVAANLATQDEVRAALGVRHLMVDEYQDTNAAQAALVRELARDCASVVVVGDPSQAIYGFRGASVAMLSAAKADLAAEEILLTHGFRCPQAVIDAAGTLLAADPAIPPRSPLSGRDAPGGVAAAAFSHRGDEMAWIADHVRRLGQQTPWDRIAILCRSLRTLRAPLSAALSRAGVPHHVGGGPRAANRNPWVERLVDLLTLIDGPESGTDLLLLEAAALSPLVGEDPLAVREAFRRARRAPDPWAALHAWSEETVPDDPAVAARRALGRLLSAVRSARSTAADADVATVAWILWSRLPAADRLAAAAADPPGCAHDDLEGGRSVGQWQATLARYVERNPGAPVSAYLDTLDAEDDDDLWRADRTEAAPAVAVLTVHQAKGLEFDHVVVPAVEEGRFPVHARSRGLLDRLGLAAPVAGDEERRLLYVALTRTRGSTTLTCTVGTEDQADATPSQYFADLVGHLSEPLALYPPPPAQPALGGLAGVSTVAHARREWGAELRRSGGSADGTVPAQPPAGVAAVGLAALDSHLPWLGEAPLPASGRLRDRPWSLSASAIDTYLDCGRRFMYDRVLRLSPFEANPHSVFGTAVHEAISAWLLAEEAPDEELLLIRLHEAFDTLAAPEMPHGLQRRSFRKRLASIAATTSKLVADMGSPVMVEANLSVERPDGHRITARPDVVNQVDGGLEIVDWKTTAKMTKGIPAHAQLCVYFHVVSANESQPVVRLRIGGVVAGHFGDVDMGDDYATVATGLVDGVVDGVTGEVFEVGDNPTCRYCSFQVLCDIHGRGLEPSW